MRLTTPALTVYAGTMIRVAVVGAGGRLGSQVCRVVEAEDDFELFARLGSKDSLEALAGADLVVDVTRHDVSPAVVASALAHGARVVVGTSGWSAERLAELQDSLDEGQTVVVIPNFSLGSTISTVVAGLIARHIPAVEIVETHHINKVDSPSGTAIRTAEIVSEARGDVSILDSIPTVPQGAESQPARGHNVAGVPVHSLRLPGVLAQQDVVFAGAGETVTLSHVTLSRDSYDAGISATLRFAASPAHTGLTVGLDRVLGISV